MKRRGSGILIHITSLPSIYGIGDLGPDAYAFVEFLVKTRQCCWQILPLNPTETIHGNSPYSSISAFAGNPLMISPVLLFQQGFLEAKDAASPPRFPNDRVDFPAVISHKETLFHMALNRFKKRKDKSDYERFCLENSEWLDDFSLFVAMKAHFQGQSWDRWPKDLRDRQPEAMKEMRKLLHERIDREKFFQFLFFKQWYALKRFCHQHGIQIIGDIPIYVAHGSADVWTNPELFKLNHRKRPRVVSGSPPDAFFEAGQVWGTPVYQWDVLKKTGYEWWCKRLEYSLRLHDVIRIDHFRGFVAYWEVPADKKTAGKGQWVDGPAADFFNVLSKKFSCLPIIAEDLGMITAEIRELMTRFSFPGMRPLIAAFSENPATHSSAPHNIERHTVVFTGTHDFNTVRGWFENDATPENKERLFRYLGRMVPAHDIHWEFIRLAMMSVGNMVIIPMQDVLGLDGTARMNSPGTAYGNWEWRLSWEKLTPSITEKLKDMAELYGRD
ncbi:MAG TPA: 4-alpha-glucanotransferase [Deltaproteobacteria bacterium]|nr:4-alpha-glucanotransferase [Deltaproteobacteria bacterium]